MNSRVENILPFQTIADLVERAGARSVIAAAKTVGLLLDRQFSVGAYLHMTSSRQTGSGKLPLHSTTA